MSASIKAELSLCLQGYGCLKTNHCNVAALGCLPWWATLCPLGELNCSTKRAETGALHSFSTLLEKLHPAHFIPGWRTHFHLYQWLNWTRSNCLCPLWCYALPDFVTDAYMKDLLLFINRIIKSFSLENTFKTTECNLVLPSPKLNLVPKCHIGRMQS